MASRDPKKMKSTSNEAEQKHTTRETSKVGRRRVYDSSRKLQHPLTRCLNLYCYKGSGMIFNFFIVLALFSIWGWAIFTLINWGFEKDYQRYASGLEPVNFLAGIIFYMWLAENNADSYNEPQRNFRMLYLSIQRLSAATWNCVQASMSSTAYWENEADPKNPCAPSTEAMDKQLFELYFYFDALAFYILRLYIDHDKTNFATPLTSLREALTQDESKKKLDASTLFQSATDKKTQTTHDNALLVNLEQYNGNSHVTLRYIINQLSMSINSLSIPASLKSNLMLKWDALSETFFLLDPAVTIRPEMYIRTHYGLIMFVYLGVIIPFVMHQKGSDILLILYPFVMTAFTGNMIIRNWEGSPFDQTNPFGTRLFFEWRDSIRTQIQHHYESTVRFLLGNNTQTKVDEIEKIGTQARLYESDDETETYVDEEDQFERERAKLV